MSNDVEEIVTTIISPIFNSRFYWDTTPQGGPPKDPSDGSYLPFAIAQIVGGTDEEYIDQTLPDHENVRLQIVTFSPSSLTSSRMCRTVRKTLLASYVPCGIIGSPVAVYDPRLLLRGRAQHFSLWIKP